VKVCKRCVKVVRTKVRLIDLEFTAIIEYNTSQHSDTSAFLKL
jgi:hypothetical protein